MRQELIELSEWWSPYNKTPAVDPKPAEQARLRRVQKTYQAYRERSTELYAQALSVMLNSPGELSDRAPNFYRAFLNYIDRKPDVIKAFMEMQMILAGDRNALGTNRMNQALVMFDDGRRALTAHSEAIRGAHRSMPERLSQWLEAAIFSTTGPAQRRAKAAKREAKEGLTSPDFTEDDAQAAWYALDELHQINNEYSVIVGQTENKIMSPLRKEGITPEDVGEFLLHNRVINERGQIANPLGHIPATSKQQLEFMRERLGDDRYELLVKKMEQWHREIVFPQVELAVERGIYPADLVAGLEQNKDFYSTFMVIRHLERSGKVPSGIFAQVGTFEGVMNPFDATMMKLQSLNRFGQLNQAKRPIRKVLEESYDGVEIRKLSAREAGVGRDTPRKKAEPGFDYMWIMDDGKGAWYEVPQEIVDSFKRHDIGTLKRVADFSQSFVYKRFHPLFVTYNPGFMVNNLPRDFRRTWVNIGTIGSKHRKIMLDKLIADGMDPKQAKKQAKKQNITIGQIMYAYWKASPVAWRRARGVSDELIDKMMNEKALNASFALRADDKEISTYNEILAQSGIRGPVEGQHMMRRIIGGMLNLVASINTFQETQAKVAVYNMLDARGIPTEERSYITRTFAGTPNFTKKGLITPLTNGVFMYSNVRWQGMQADISLATNPQTRMGWWWRRMMWTFVPATLNFAGLIGLFGDELKALFERIGDYFNETYDVIPLGFSYKDGTAFGKAIGPVALIKGAIAGDDVPEGDMKTIFLTLPQDDMGRIIRSIYLQFLRSLEPGKPFGFTENQPPTAGESFNRVVEGIWGDTIGGMNPAFDIGWKWSQYAMGQNPRERFFGSDIVPRDDWNAGGLYRARHMAMWTTNQFGVLSTVTHGLRRPMFGGPGTPEQEWHLETTIKSMPGISRLLRVSDRGLKEDEWRLLHEQAKEDALLRVKLPKIINPVRRERYRLYALPLESLTDQQRRRLAILNAWYGDIYLPLAHAIKVASEAGDEKRAEELRDRLGEQTERFKGN